MLENNGLKVNISKMKVRKCACMLHQRRQQWTHAVYVEREDSETLKFKLPSEFEPATS